MVVHDDFDWDGDAPLRTPWDDTVIYEVHVKGFTRLHNELPEELRGTYAGLGSRTITRYLNDLFLFLDQAYRVSWGQVPSRDFHTPLGPLVSYIPAAGHWLTGRLGAALPVGMGLTILALAPAITHVLASRLHPVLALFFVKDWKVSE